MKLSVRSLNASGVDLFRRWLTTREGNPPAHILDDDRYVDDLAQNYLIDTERIFDTTFELGKYLSDEVFGDISLPSSLRAESGMWAWLSLAMLPNILGRSAKKLGKPLDVPHYIEGEGSSGQRLGYRLIVRTAWELVRLHGDKSFVALGSKKSPWGEMAEQLSSRQQVFAHTCFWVIAHRLYLDKTGEPRRGATSQRPATARKDPRNLAGRGGVRRLPFTFRQFDRTYNTREMSLEQILPLLPGEYAKWVN